jgi:hypothetical protein
MKKILLLLPIIGICSSLFAQAPKVENVQAQQVVGTKDVQITFQCSAKAGVSSLNFEVWFRENLAQTQWGRAFDLRKVDDTWFFENNDFNPDTGNSTIYSHKLDGITEALETQTVVWKAGIDAPDVSTSEAQVRVIAFYEKTDEYGTVTPSAQVSGWNGIDDGNGNSTSDSNGTAETDTNSTNNELDVYFLSSTQVGQVTSYAKEDAGNYVFEVFYDEPAEHNGYVGTEVKQLGAVYDDAGIWRLDESIGPWQLNASIFPTLDSVGAWITEQALVSQGKLTYSDPAPGDGI